MGGNSPGGNFPGGSFPGGIHQGGIHWVGILRGGIHQGGFSGNQYYPRGLHDATGRTAGQNVTFSVFPVYLTGLKFTGTGVRSDFIKILSYGFMSIISCVAPCVILSSVFFKGRGVQKSIEATCAVSSYRDREIIPHMREL